MKVPALFTSYHEGEAKEDYALLSSVMGAKMLTTEPVLNPVRVGYHFIDPCDEGGAANPFFQPNMYAMCFQGKYVRNYCSRDAVLRTCVFKRTKNVGGLCVSLLLRLSSFLLTNAPFWETCHPNSYRQKGSDRLVERKE